MAAPCASHSLLPITRFQENELDDLIQTLEKCSTKLVFQWGPLCVKTNNPISPRSNLGELIDVQEAPRFRRQDLKLLEFEHYWSHGIPVVITDVKMQGKWDPEYFIQAYGTQMVTIVECETQKTMQRSVAYFFERFGKHHDGTGIWKLKVHFCSSSCFMLTWPTRIGHRRRILPKNFRNYSKTSKVPSRVLTLRDQMAY